MTDNFHIEKVVMNQRWHMFCLVNPNTKYKGNTVDVLEIEETMSGGLQLFKYCEEATRNFLKQYQTGDLEGYRAEKLLEQLLDEIYHGGHGAEKLLTQLLIDEIYLGFPGVDEDPLIFLVRILAEIRAQMPQQMCPQERLKLLCDMCFPKKDLEDYRAEKIFYKPPMKMSQKSFKKLNLLLELNPLSQRMEIIISGQMTSTSKLRRLLKTEILWNPEHNSDLDISIWSDEVNVCILENGFFEIRSKDGKSIKNKKFMLRVCVDGKIKRNQPVYISC